MTLEELSVLFSCKLCEISAHSLPELTLVSVFCVGIDLKDFSSSLKSCDVNEYVCDRVYVQWDNLQMFFLSKKVTCIIQIICKSSQDVLLGKVFGKLKHLHS